MLDTILYSPVTLVEVVEVQGVGFLVHKVVQEEAEADFHMEVEICFCREKGYQYYVDFKSEYILDTLFFSFFLRRNFIKIEN